MNAEVEFVDEASDATRIVKLVYPRQADIAANRISILTTVGAGLIGPREGKFILWTEREGNERWLTLDQVRQAGCAETGPNSSHCGYAAYGWDVETTQGDTGWSTVIW